MGWLGLIFFFSSLTGENLPDLSKFSLDKAVHGIEYFILGLLMVRAFTGSFPNMNLTKMITLSIILCALYAASDEWHQRFIPGRECDLFDFLADILGAVSAILLFIYIKGYKERAKH